MANMTQDQIHDQNSLKLFKDTVHGYISIPKILCDLFIDTPIFQRLRRIEQTSARTLYPCARHDRFSHSIGTYYIATLIVSAIEKHSQNVISTLAEQPEESTKIWQKLSNTFLIASLLHDCGHAPFSHTYEHYYDKANKLDKILCSICLSMEVEFKKDFSREPTLPKPHEKVSAIVLLRHYSDAIKCYCNCTNTEVDPVLAARMVIGCQYTGNNLTLEKSVANCLIQLLNGGVIDVDRLDYLIRDQWAAGISGSIIDLFRLTDAVRLAPHAKNLRPCFYKSALSVLKSYLEAKQFQKTWVHHHHKVEYSQMLLDKAIENLAELLGNGNKQIGFEKLFTIDSFEEVQKIVVKDTDGQNNVFSIHLLSDDDIIYLFKYFEKETNIAEYFSRNYSLKPLWKTYEEYCSEFSIKRKIDHNHLQLGGRIYKSAKKIIEEFIESKQNSFGTEIPSQVVIRDITIKETQILPNQFPIVMDNNNVVTYSELYPNQGSPPRADFFLVFVPAIILPDKNKIFDALTTCLP